MSWLYWGRAQDVIQETKQSQVRPSNKLSLSFLPFPVRHPAHDFGSELSSFNFKKSVMQYISCVSGENVRTTCFPVLWYSTA